MMNCPKFYKPAEFIPPEFETLDDIHARGLDTPCPNHKFHKWLYLPKEAGQKQYIYCLNCGEHSHT